MVGQVISEDPELDLVFRALADPARRRILDLLRASPGLTVGELSDSFEMTRFGIRKHLLLLQEANLVVSVWQRPAKRLYLNAVPIQMIHDRWLSEYSKLWAARLTSLKAGLEYAADPRLASAGDDLMRSELDADDHSDRQVYVVYIRTTKEQLWEALLDPAATNHYYLGLEVRSSGEAGGPIHYRFTDPKTGAVQDRVTGTITEIVPHKRLVHTFKAHVPEVDENDPESRVTYELEVLGDVVRLTLTHDQFGGRNRTFEATTAGWPLILSGLKSYLESGRGLSLG